MITVVEALEDDSGEDVSDETYGGDRNEDHSFQPESVPDFLISI